MKRDDIMEIDDYFYSNTANCQTYTDKEIGIPGIRLFGHLVNKKAQKPLVMHIHPDCMEICYIVKGNQIYKTENEEYPLTGDNVFIAYPNELHGNGSNPNGKFEIYWIQLDMRTSKNFLNIFKPLSIDLQNSLLNIKNTRLNCDNNLKPLLENAFRELPNNNKMIKLSGLSNLLTFLCKIIEHDKSNLQFVSPTIQDAKDYIEQNILNRIKLEFLANHVGLSLSHFKKRFKQETGETPNDFINYLRIQKAKEMLKMKEQSITDIAYALDFSSSSYFSVVFKHYTSLTPTGFIIQSDNEA